MFGEALGFILVISICTLPIYIAVKVSERKQKKGDK